MARADRVQDRVLPVLLLHPLAERWTPVAWSREVLHAIPAIPAPTRFRGMASCEHWPMESPGIDVLRSELAGLLRAAADQDVPGFSGRGQASAEG